MLIHRLFSKLCSVFAVLCLVVLASACGGGGGSGGGNGGSSSEPPAADQSVLTQESLDQANAVAAQAAPEIDSAIAMAHQTQSPVDASAIALDVSRMPNVQSAAATPSGAAIVVQLKSGLFFNLLIVNMADDRLFVVTPNSPSSAKVSGDKALQAKSLGDKSLPIQILESVQGHEALILAPFRSKGLGDNPDAIGLGDNPDAIEGLLKSAGFHVTYWKDAEATVDRFRGNKDRYKYCFHQNLVV